MRSQRSGERSSGNFATPVAKPSIGLQAGVRSTSRCQWACQVHESKEGDVVHGGSQGASLEPNQTEGQGELESALRLE